MLNTELLPHGSAFTSFEEARLEVVHMLRGCSTIKRISTRTCENSACS